MPRAQAMSKAQSHVKIAFSIVLTLALSCILASSALAATADEVVAKLQSRYGSIDSVSADFTQEVFLKGGAAARTYGGKVYFKKPGKMRWAYDNPGRDELVSNGARIWFYQGDLNQVIEMAYGSDTAGLATDFLSGIGDLRKDFTVRLVKEKALYYTLELTPSGKAGNLKAIRIDVDKKEHLVVKTSVTDPFGTRTEVSFRNIKVNTELKDTLFDFIVPRGADVIKQNFGK